MSQRTIPPRNFPQNQQESTQSNLQQWTTSSTAPIGLDLPDGTRTVLVPTKGPSNDRVCHLIDRDHSPLCGSEGTFQRITSLEADSEVDRLCDNCQTQQTGKPRTRPCPMCRQRIPVNRWPQHVRRCVISHEGGQTGVPCSPCTDATVTDSFLSGGVSVAFITYIEKRTTAQTTSQRQEITAPSAVNGWPNTRSHRRTHNCCFLLSRHNCSDCARTAIPFVSDRVTLRRVSVSHDTSNDRLTITRYDPAASR